MSTANGFTIERLDPKEVSKIEDLVEQMEWELFRLLDVKGKEFPRSIRLDRPELIVFAAMRPGEAIGFAAFHPLVVNLGEPPKTCLIYALYVDRPHRRKGVAKALLRRGETYCWDNKIENLHLTVHELNRPALNLYETIGFNPLSRNLGKKATAAGPENSSRAGGNDAEL